MKLTNAGKLRKMKAEADAMIQLQACKIRLLEEGRTYWKHQSEQAMEQIRRHIERATNPPITIKTISLNEYEELSRRSESRNIHKFTGFKNWKAADGI